MKYVIDFLSNHKDKVKEIAECFYKEWGHLCPDKTIVDFENSVALRCNEDKIPFCLVAINDEGNVLGTVSVVENDLETRKDLVPWISGFYVKKEYRSNGIGTRLIRNAISFFENSKTGKLYLYTENAEAYYLKLGWKLINREDHYNAVISIMDYDLTTQNNGI